LNKIKRLLSASRRKKKEETSSHFFLYLAVYTRAHTKQSVMKMPPQTQKHKRRIGERDLWDMIVNNDDISFTHILPRLNSTDVKFLFEVNSETRALIKRSTRKKELRKAFQVGEMSSISTLEIALENRSFWVGYLRDCETWLIEPRFCCAVAETNKLELLKWAREEKKCDWSVGTMRSAAGNGNLEMLKYCVANECPVDEISCARAADHGHLECLKYLHEEAKAPWDNRTASWAAENGHLHILEYLVERKYKKYFKNACTGAARRGHLDCLKFLHEVAKAPCGKSTLYDAYKYNRPECVKYLLENNCPLPVGLRYEGGILRWR
jgi:hypothetical protein